MRIDMYRPGRNEYDPCTKQLRQQFVTAQPPDDYDLYSENGSVFVVRTTPEHGTCAIQCMAHGTAYISGAEGRTLGALLARKYPRPGLEAPAAAPKAARAERTA